MARILIFGGRGQLGRDLHRLFLVSDTVLSLDLPELDIADAAAVNAAVADFGPDLVINAAAYTDVERAEDDPDAAHRINVTGAGHVAAAAARAGAPVVYYSTDFVFDGAQKAAYDEEATVDAATPLSVYGRTKWLGEEATRAAAPQHLILRTAWLYGPGGNNFVEKILAAARTRPVLRVVWDEVGCPTHTWDLAEATQSLWRVGAAGTYHLVNGGCCSRHEFAEVIVAQAGLCTPVQPCLASEFPMKARRPVRSVLSTEKYSRATGRAMRPWRDALAHYLERRETTL